MKRTHFLLLLLTAFASWMIVPVFAGGSDEIVIQIPAPDDMTERSSGVMFAQLSAEDVASAKSQVRAAYEKAKEEGVNKSIVAELPGGMLQVAEPIVLGPADNGDAQRPIIWRGSDADPQTRLSGGARLTNWTEVRPGVVETILPEAVTASQNLRIIWNAGSGQQPVRCRIPKEGYFRIEKSGEDRRTHFTWQEGDLKAYEDLSNVELVFLHDWSITRCPIKSLDVETRTLRVPRQIGSGLDFFKIDHWEAHPRYFLANSIEFLTEPGEWHLDRNSGTLTYRLQDGETADNLVLIAPRLENVLIMQGSPDQPVRHIRLENIRFSNTGPAPENEHTYWGIQATWHHEPKPDGSGLVNVPPMRGVVDVTHAENCHFDHVGIEDVAGTGLSLGRGTVACVLRNSRIAGCGGNGVMVGAADQDHPAGGNVIDRCHIANAGEVFYGAVGIWIGFAPETTVSNSTICNMPYTGVSAGWLWSPKPTVNRAQKIIDNHIAHCLQILSDGGGIYTLGFQPDSLLTGNHIHDIPLNAGRAESNGMFLDEGTKGFTIENNFIHATDKSPLRFHRADKNLVKNNYLIPPNEETPMIRYNNTPEVNITKVDNITEVNDLEEALSDWRESRDHP